MEVSGVYSAASSVEWIDPIVKRHSKDNAVMDACMRCANAVAARIVISGTGNLLASNYRIIARIPEFKT
jgi:hypothetical protein